MHKYIIGMDLTTIKNSIETVENRIDALDKEISQHTWAGNSVAFMDDNHIINALAKMKTRNQGITDLKSKGVTLDETIYEKTYEEWLDIFANVCLSREKKAADYKVLKKLKSLESLATDQEKRDILIKELESELS